MKHRRILSVKKSYEIGIDARHALEGDMSFLLDCVSDVGKAWRKARSLRPVSFWLEVFSYELVDLLDSMADIYRCTEGDCREECHADWDFCEKHGIVLPESRTEIEHDGPE